MDDDFKPPIKTRTTEDLLLIVGAPKKWNPRAIKLANDELYSRKVDLKTIEQAKYIETKKEKLEILKKATESYSILDFIFSPKSFLFQLIFFWELKKDGYTLKAKQLKNIRITIVGIIIFVWLLSKIL